MARDLFSFRWSVFPGKYRWVEVRFSSGGSRWLAKYYSDQAPADGNVRVLIYPDDDPDARTYMPLRSEPTLFLAFSQLESKEESILAFAERYGPLGVPPWGLFEARAAAQSLREAGVRFVEHTENMIRGEAVSYWASHIRAMRASVGLWDLLRRGDASGLRQRLRWESDASGRQNVFFHADLDAPPEGANCILLNTLMPGSESQFHQPHGAYMLAREYIARNINGRLGDQVCPVVQWEDGGRRLPMYFVPRSLVGALWLQFARAVDGGADYRPCKGCGKLFEVSGAASRTDKQFCSNACRSKAYRDRQEQARQMFAAGKTVREIAKALDAKPEAVKGWVKGLQ